MTKYTHEQIAALLATITPGKWEWYDGDLRTDLDHKRKCVLRYCDPNGEGDPDWEWTIYADNQPDAEFIAAAPDIAAQLLARVEALEAFARQQIADYEEMAAREISPKFEFALEEEAATEIMRLVAEEARKALNESEAPDVS